MACVSRTGARVVLMLAIVVSAQLAVAKRALLGASGLVVVRSGTKAIIGAGAARVGISVARRFGALSALLRAACHVRFLSAILVSRTIASTAVREGHGQKRHHHAQRQQDR